MSLFSSFLFIIFLGLFPLFAQVKISALGGVNYFDSRHRFQPAPAGFINFSFETDFNGGLEFVYHFTDPVLQIRTPSQNISIPSNVQSVTIFCFYNFNTPVFDLKIKPLIGIGTKWIQRDSYIISLGVLGDRTIKSATEKYFNSAFAIDFSKEITRKIALSIRPAASLYGSKMEYVSFSLAGGIDVRLF